MQRTEDGQTVKLADYRPTDFVLHGVAMTLMLFEGHADVATTLTLERRAGVASVPGRSYHGFNRTFATDANDTSAASGQSGKTEETIRRIYKQPKPSEKAKLAMQFDSLRRGA